MKAIKVTHALTEVVQVCRDGIPWCQFESGLGCMSIGISYCASYVTIHRLINMPASNVIDAAQRRAILSEGGA